MANKRTFREVIVRHTRVQFLSCIFTNGSSKNVDTANQFEYLFVEPEDNIDLDHADVSTFAQADKRSLQDRWHSNKGKYILKALLESGFDKGSIRQLVGKIYGKYDLRGAPLREYSFSKLNLT